MRRKHSMPEIPWKIILAVGILIVLAFLIRPWLHDFAMYLYTNPIVIEFIVIWYLLHRFVLNKNKKKVTIVTMEGKEETVAQVNFLSYFVLFVMFILAGTISGILPQLHIVNELQYETIIDLPENTEDVRLMPLEVAERFSRDSLQLSQFRLGNENIAFVNGSLAWSFPLVPDGGILTYILENKGIVYVDATTQERTSNIVFQDMKVGDEMQIFDNLYWNVYNQKYFIDLDDPYYTLTPDGDIITVISVISYSFHQNFGLVYTVPEFGGVLIVDNKGQIEFLDKEASLESEILEGNRLYPENLARYYVETFKFDKGVINRFFIHEDQIEIRDVSFTNRQPFLMDTQEGLKWFISAEPASASRGIFKIFLVDARTGDVQVKALDIDETLTGPIKARDFVRRSNPTVDWNVFRIVEPLPFVKDSTLFWKVVVIPGDAAGIAFQAFVNSKTNDVISLDTDSQIRSFIKEDVIEIVEDVDEETTDQNEIVKQIRQKISEIEVLVEKLN